MDSGEVENGFFLHFLTLFSSSIFLWLCAHFYDSTIWAMVWATLHVYSHPVVHIFILSWVSTLPHDSLSSIPCVSTCAHTWVCTFKQNDLFILEIVIAPYLPMWDHRNNFCWCLPHVGLFEFWLSQCVQSLNPHICGARLLFRSQGVAKCLMIAFCEILLYLKESVPLNNLRSSIVKLVICESNLES